MKNNCYNCNKEISTQNKSNICINCKTHKCITFTNVKKLYHLLEEEINNSNLFTISVKCNGTIGRKFLIRDIEKLAKNIYSKIDNKDKRKIKYLHYLEIKNRKIKLDNYIEKHSIDKNNIISLYNEYIDNKSNYKHIIKKIKDKNDEFLLIKRRTELLDTMIKNNIKKRWKDYVKQLEIYKLSIKHGYSNIHNVIKEIKNQIDNRNKREYELRELLKLKKLNLRDDSILCKLYIDGGIDTVKNKCKDINTIIDIVNVMDEMNYYYTKTNYNIIKRKLINKCDVHEINEKAKIITLSMFNNVNINKLPINIYKLYYKVLYEKELNMLYDKYKKKKYSIILQYLDDNCCICYDRANRITNCYHFYCDKCKDKIKICAICREII